ncbi:MAG: alpha/beta hydrolase [Bacteroidetes bacterium]|nr:alpha/beta hydrolase [Bacteroidota bacterium]
MEKKTKKKILIGILIGIILLAAGFLFALPLLVMDPMVNMHVSFDETWTAEKFGLKADHFFVKTEDGLNISAYKIMTERPKAVIVCLSGIHNPSATVYFGHARLFKKHNYGTVLFDMRAHGESGGDMICLGYKEYLDTKAIVEHIKSDSLYKDVPIVVMGLSMGGVTAINSTGEIPEIDGLISLSAYSSWEDVFYESMSEEAPAFLTNIVEPFVPLTAAIKYNVNSWAISPKKEIQKLGNRPALLIHSREDSQVPFDNFKRILESAPSHVETYIREGDLHFITGHFTEPEKDTVYAAKILQFLDKNFSAR